MHIPRDFAKKQFEYLREEIMYHYKEISATERLFVTAAVVYYGWLFTNLNMVTKLQPIIWYLPVAIPFLGLIRYVGLMANMMKIGKYILLYEASMKNATVAENESNSIDIPGWEEWLSNRRSHWFGGYQLVFWILFLLGTIIIAVTMNM